jgi:hypothetical protein
MTDSAAVYDTQPAHARWCLQQYVMAHDALDHYGVARTAPREPCTWVCFDPCGFRCYNCRIRLKEYTVTERIDLLMERINTSVDRLTQRKPLSRENLIGGPDD